MVKKEKNFDFEKNLSKLENIVEKLESEDTPIEKSLEFFEEGVKISKELSGKLDEVKIFNYALTAEEICQEAGKTWVSGSCV